MSKIDLHIHSSYSDDGEFSPQELVKACKECGMEVISITDHNSVGGVAEAFGCADGLHILSGVEFDCTFCDHNVHLLGYGFDYKRPEFARIEQDILQQEHAAAKEKIRLFRDVTGIWVDEQEILAEAPEGIVAGELIGEILFRKKESAQYELLRPYLSGGEKADMPNVHFYWDFFAQGKPAYVPIRYQPLEDAVSLIHEAGGLAVLAHPGQNLKGKDELLCGILETKVDGLEVFSSYHSEAQCDHYLAFAKEHQLMVTAGSDYHGKHKPAIRLGGHGASWTDEMLLAEIMGLNSYM